MATTADKRYPFDDLERLITGDVARMLNIGGAAVLRYREHGVARPTAETLAERAGFVPYEVWPQLLDDLIAEVERDCAAPDCPATFVVRWRGAKRRYCSDTCRKRTNARHRYATNPQTRQRRIERARAYKAAVAELERRRAERRAA